MKTPAVSIIVAVYNAERYLEKCVDSLVSQTLADLEIILVNDGSKDSSGALCDRYAAKDARVKVIHQENQGQTAARTAGLAIAKGSYVHFVDSDDWLAPEAEATMYAQAVEHDADIVTCDSVFHKATKEIPARQAFDAGIYDKKKLKSVIYPRMIYSGRFFYFGIYAAMWNKLFRRTLVTPHIMSVDPAVRIGEDGLTTFASFLDARTVVVVKDLLYHYRDDNDTSLTRSYVREQFDSALLLIKYLREIAAKHKTAIDLGPQIDAYLAYNVRSIILEEFYYRIKKSYRKRYDYLRRIVSHPEVVKTFKRLDTSSGYTKEQVRFIGLVRDGKVKQLMTASIMRSLDQRLRFSIRKAAYQNPVATKVFEAIRRVR